MALIVNILLKSLPWKEDDVLGLSELGLEIKKDMYDDNDDNSSTIFLNYFPIFLCAFNAFIFGIFRQYTLLY